MIPATFCQSGFRTASDFSTTVWRLSSAICNRFSVPDTNLLGSLAAMLAFKKLVLDTHLTPDGGHLLVLHRWIHQEGQTALPL